MKKAFFLTFFLPVLLLVSCSQYQALLKSNDLSLKYAKAKEYYDRKDYYKATPLFEELLAVYKGTKDVEDIYYYYAYCQYYSNEFLVAAYHFKTISTTYPNNPHAQECLFMNAKCYVNLSPKYELDQEYTNKAINEFQLFVNTYPTSQLVSQANNYIDLMRLKLQQKAFAAAKLYYDMGSYKAAAVALADMARNFPDANNLDEIMFLILKSDYLYSLNSVALKQPERYQKTVSFYNEYKVRLSQSRYAKDAQDIFDESSKFLNKPKLIAKANEPNK
jgi:outer membrane protein assembly factor BamD